MSISDHLEEEHRHDPVHAPNLPSQLSNSLNNYLNSETKAEMVHQSQPEDVETVELMGAESEEPKDYSDVMNE